MSAAPAAALGATPAPAQGELARTIRLRAGMAGILLGALMAGLNNRVGSLALADVTGALGLASDDASWLVTAYSAGELAAMPFAVWFAITLSTRRFTLWMLGVAAVVAVVIPFVHDLRVLLALRFVHGVACGSLIPLLMMATLRFLPASRRVHGLALFALTATFTPQLSIWLAGQWIDNLFDWRWVYWQIIPVAGIAGALAAWGLPRETIQFGRFRDADWPGLALGVPALCLILVAFDQGVRLDWLRSSMVGASLAGGFCLLAGFLLAEWYHPAPFMNLKIMGRRNLALGFTLFVCLLVTLTSGSLLPSQYLASVQGYRALQTAPLALIIGLPQLVMGSAVAALLYQRWVDARMVFASGLVLIAAACFLGTQITADWNRDQFVAAQAMQAVGQPMAVVSMLFLGTSVVQPQEGPSLAGVFNSLRAFGSAAGPAVVTQLMIVRSRFHAEMLLDRSGSVANAVPDATTPSQLASIIGEQSLVLSIADTYLVLGVLALLMAPVALMLTYIPPPEWRASLAPSSPPSLPSSQG